ncbi:MAG: FAD-binding protein [Acetobacteraceae bacterium]|nr:FAD-binding protein [Acetobacteraceae bacterium]
MTGQSSVTGLRTDWENWSGNLKHRPPTDGDGYYFKPTTRDELKAVLALAKTLGATVRASGQRHSQPPLVADDNRNAPPAKPDTLLVDMSCYVDIGESGITLGPGPSQVTVNPGLREDFVDAFLTRHNLMFKTVTAGGFFSIGGMTAVDVHGATLDAPIFAETAAAFTILGADGTETVIDVSTPAIGKWSPLQFARVSLGGLGIVTRITVDVLPRPYATTVQGQTARYLLKDRQAFIDKFKSLTAEFDRMEAFYSPYAAAPNVPFVPLPNFLVLGWNTVANPDPKTPNSAADPATACALAGKGEFGAPFLGGLAGYGAKYVRESQYFSDPYNPFHLPPVPTAGYAAIALDEIESQAGAANEQHSDLWLSAASQVIFMSYFFEMPRFDDAGLGKVWDGMDVVARRVIQTNGAFHIAAPMEFRFIKAGNSAMSGAYSESPDAVFVNLDLIGFIEPTPAADYPKPLLQFFADVERDWVAMGGMPHNGKVYGFYDPSQPAGSCTAPFNLNFLSALRARRGERLNAFNAYRKQRDPDGLFYNAYMKQLLEG